MSKNLRIILPSMLLLIAVVDICVAQPSVEVFGQNRVQYRRFAWNFYEGKQFKIYHYDRSGRELARYVVEQAERDLAIIERTAGALFSGKLSVILYNSYDDFEQSNIGLNSEMQLQSNNPAGTVNIVGDKLVLFFTGKHEDLMRQLRQGMAQIAMERLMYGDNLREIVRNAVSIDLPAWLTSGYVGYVVDGWTNGNNSEWKNIIAAKENVNFNDLLTAKPQLSGKAFWKYLVERHGESQVQNLLYAVQLKGNLNKAIKLTFNENIKATFDSLIGFYKGYYAAQEGVFATFDSSAAVITIPQPDSETELRDIMVSPRGYDVAYVQWKHGEYKVIFQKMVSAKATDAPKHTILLSGGVKNHRQDADPNYPLMAWSNTGFKLGIVFKNKNQIRVKVYNSVRGTVKDFKIPASRFDRITGFSFMEDDDVIVLSAIKRGQSDLFKLRLKGARLTQLTDDAWDDEAPVFLSGGARKGIVFLSNRPKPFLNIKPLPNELPAGEMKAYFYNTTTKSYDLLQLSEDRHGDVSQVIPFGSDHFAYLSGKSGVQNRYVVLFARTRDNKDSAYAVPVTNYGSNILYQQYHPASAKVADVLRSGNTNYVYFREIAVPTGASDTLVKDLPIVDIVDGLGARGNKTEKRAPRATVEREGTPSNSGLTLKEGDYFQTEFSAGRQAEQDEAPPSDELIEDNFSEQAQKTDEGKPADAESEPTRETPENFQGKLAGDGRTLFVDSTYLLMRAQPYRASFKPDFFSVRLDNSVIFNRYQSYTNSGGQYINPSLSGMFMARLFDKMEDYRFTGGLRVPANFGGLTYFAQFENFRRRIDWSLIFLRDEKKVGYNFLVDPTLPPLKLPGKTVTNILQGSVHYPLDKVKGFHLHTGLRQDQMIVKAENIYGLALPNVQDFWTMSRLEFVYDDTKNPVLNIWNGIRYKFYAEYMYKLYTDNDAYSLSDGSKFVDKGGFYNFGADFRYYQKIYKNFISALRIAGAHAGGGQQIIYYLGGKENDLVPSREYALPPSNKNNYAFQSLASNLRGYGQNARNGNTYALMNAELRLPLMTTFFRRPFHSALLNNLQAVAFVDLGSAWEGLLPTSDNVNRNYTFGWPPNVQAPTVTVRIPNYDKGGLALGYGLGLRTVLFGYFAGFDAAWNINKRFHWYLSIGTDF